MKTLIVGDLHLLETIALPIVEKKAQEHEVRRIILVGDYFDQWGETANVNLYYQQLSFLKDWCAHIQKERIEVTCLLGNHDIPYLTGRLKHYSIKDTATVQEIKHGLLGLGARIAAEEDGYLISHAGFAGQFAPEDWYFEPIETGKFEELDKLDQTVGYERGGNSELGSVFWADYRYELANYYNPAYPKQIAGHTPVEGITRNKPDGSVIAVDTFSLYQNHQPIGDGSLLLIDDGAVRVVRTEISEVISEREAEGRLFRLGYLAK
jgi:hypothetical protein